MAGFKLRAPYGLLACAQLDMASEEAAIVCAIDALLQCIRKTQLSGSKLDIPSFVQAHVNAAEEYYSDFTAEDMLKLDMLSIMAAAVMEKLKEE